ncbi:MAG: HAD family hydrolase [Acidobacteriia bacterium]|nr:HAD family hydrolase [Terriglobia bacterium]
MNDRPRPRKSPAPAGATAARAGVAAVFLDRDGTITEEMGYINHLDRLQLYPWAAKAIRKLNLARRPVVVVTNQSGVARGVFTEDLLHQAHRKIARELAERKAKLDAIYYCPHHPEGRVEPYRLKCQCRKPATGMVMDAVKRFGIDLASSFVVGDTYRDMELGFNAGARTILVLTGYGRGEYEHQRHHWPRLPDHVAEDLLEAVEIILNGGTRSGSVAHRPVAPFRRA